MAAARLFGQLLGCAVRTIVLLAGRRLHRSPDRLGSDVTLPDGRRFVVFRETVREEPTNLEPVMLAVWFRLRGVPPGAHRRRWLFERLSVLNTVLFAGFDGFVVKLWMVDPASSDYAGLYTWASAEGADRYARYITAVLSPLSVRGSVGASVHPDRSLDDHVTSPADAT